MTELLFEIMYYIDPRYDGTFLLSTHKHYTACWCPGHVMLQVSAAIIVTQIQEGKFVNTLNVHFNSISLCMINVFLF